MEAYYPSDLANIELQMLRIELMDSDKPSNSWIHEHFVNGPGTKILLYVNRLVPINRNLDVEQIKTVGNHCVVVEGITKWTHQMNKNNEKYEIDCFKIATFSGGEQTRYIPVDHPFWEDVQSEAEAINKKYLGSDLYSRKLDTLGKKLAKTKYGSLEGNWFAKSDKYNMIFIRRHPCYQLKFASKEPEVIQGTDFKIFLLIHSLLPLL